MYYNILQRTVTGKALCTRGWFDPDTLHHTAPHCNALQCAASLCNTLQHTATHHNTLQNTAPHCKILHYTHYNILPHTVTLCNTLQHTATHCNTLQCTATLCNTLQHTATGKALCTRRWLDTDRYLSPKVTSTLIVHTLFYYFFLLKAPLPSFETGKS